MAAAKSHVGIIGANAHDGWSMRAHLVCGNCWRRAT